MRKTNKKMIAILLILILVASFIPFKVFAENSYTITFSIGQNQNGYRASEEEQYTPHSMILDDNNRLIIDGQTVEPRLANDSVAAYTATINNGVCTMTITNGDEVTLNFNSANKFELFANGQPIGANTIFNATNSVAIQDYVNQSSGGNDGQNPPPQNPTYNVNFGTALWNVKGVEVTATMEGKTINNSQAVTIEENDIITLTNYNPDTMEVRVTENTSNNPFSTTLTVNTNNGVTTTKIANRTNNGGLPTDLVFAVQQKQNEGQDEPGPGEDEHFFDGNAYFVWLNSENKICYHKFTELKGRPETEGQGYEINYINVSQLTDQSGNNSAYVWGQDNANWVLARDMEDENGVIRTDLTKTYIFGDGIHEEGKDRRIEMGVQLDPTGAKSGANSICSNADRNFRATIYREGYNAIEFSSNENDYTYFPCFWDQTFFSSTVDLSGTTKENPAEYDTYLLEPIIRFKDGQFSAPITAVEALDVNQNAVDIEIADGICNIKFNSNYYDNVVFKITAGGKEYFVKINRLVLDIKDNFGPDTEDAYLIARLFYSEDKSYNDFDVVATVIYNDNTTETKVISPSELRYYDEDDHNRTKDDYTLYGGKGLYESQCYIQVDKQKLVGAYFTVVTKGSLNAKEDTYKGTFSGSGEGTYYNAATRDIEL